MEVFCYSKEKEFDEAMNAYHLDKCPKCSEIVEVEMEHIFVSVVDKTMDIEEIPMLKCKNCGGVYYSYFAQEVLYGLYDELKRTGDKPNNNEFYCINTTKYYNNQGGNNV